jgi:uncharacterized membrane protein (UPF0127 family)
MKRIATVVLALAAAGSALTCRRSTAEPAASAAATPSPEAQAAADKPAASPSPTGGPAVIPLTLPSGKVLQTEVMVKDEDRMMGLMFRPSLPSDRGMLFLFEQLGKHGIWMKNCKFPIDILWLDENRRVVHLEEAVPPCKADPCPVYAPLREAAYVLELNAKQARREKALVGSEVKFTLPR